MGYHNVRDKSGKFTSKKGKKSGFANRYTTTRKKKTKTATLETYDMFILDRSGSMGMVLKETINGYNKVLSEIQSVAKDKGLKSYVSLVQFDYPNAIKAQYFNTPAENAELLNTSNYHPRGNTALYDAIAYGIEILREAVESKGKKVSVNLHIFTDGEENASTKYRSANVIKRMIEDVRDDLNWTVTFVGAGDFTSVKAVADSFGIFASNTMNYTADKAGTIRAFDTLSTANKMSRVAYSNTGVSSNDGFFSND